MKQFGIALILMGGVVWAGSAFAAAEFEVVQVGRNVTQNENTLTASVVAIAGTDAILVNVDIINIGDQATTASTSVSMSLPAGVGYTAETSKYFNMACGNFISGCAIADSGTGTAFPLDDPYTIGALAAGDDMTIQYRITITSGTVSTLSIPGVTVSDSGTGVSGTSDPLSVAPDLPPTITLNGSASTTLFVGQAYTEAGATATDDVDGDITANIITAGAVNTNIPGTYTRTYNISDSKGNAAAEATRTITVEFDTTLPTITLNGSNTVILVVGDDYADAGASALDNIDGDITGSIVTVNPVSTSTPGEYAVTYNVSDSSGNDATEATRLVKVLSTADAEAPIITLNGSASITLTVGDGYTEQGAIATDNVDGDISSQIVTQSSVDTNTAGTYTVTYNVTDLSENAAAEATRTITVNEPVEESGGSSVPVIIVGGGGGGGGGGSFTSSPAPKKADFNGDAKVDIFDFNLLMVDWGKALTGLTTDLDQNGAVDIFDFNLLMVGWNA